MQNLSSKLDWTRMLGFEQIADSRVVEQKTGKLDAKVGTKLGIKTGVKIGIKIGGKIGVKQGSKA